jgi:2-phosphosulfolactate phosphatase
VKTFVIDALPEKALQYRNDHVMVAVDVFRATTTIVTALDKGRRVYPVDSETEARALASRIPRAVLGGEVAGARPDGFAINNSPCLVAASDDRRPLILLSSAGTKLLGCCRGATAVYVACFRNLSASATQLEQVAGPVALIGAGARGQPRAEDSILCARLGRRLMGAGFVPEDEQTAEEVRSWGDVDIASIRSGPSADFLRSTGQQADIDFVIDHIDDLDLVVVYDGTEARMTSITSPGMVR